ncbi:MAG: Cd(II)/Pb(II)-responsive transcriptional regulator [Burkholderiales bacterium]|nr:MAG: Cd(II)/Pb(II)-responsive transcriptional regulator [Burkholderiales bacterium]
MSDPGLRIGEAARQTGLTAASIRYYEQEGLLPAPPRSGSSYRIYGEADLHRLRFIRLCRAMDMSLGEVRTLLGLDLKDKADCRAARQTLDEHLAHVRQRLSELRALERNLRSLRDRCDGSSDQCHIIEALHRQADLTPADALRGA